MRAHTHTHKFKEEEEQQESECVCFILLPSRIGTWSWTAVARTGTKAPVRAWPPCKHSAPFLPFLRTLYTPAHVVVLIHIPPVVCEFPSHCALWAFVLYFLLDNGHSFLLGPLLWTQETASPPRVLEAGKMAQLRPPRSPYGFSHSYAVRWEQPLVPQLLTFGVG